MSIEYICDYNLLIQLRPQIRIIRSKIKIYDGEFPRQLAPRNLLNTHLYDIVFITTDIQNDNST